MNALKQILRQILFFRWAFAGIALGVVVSEVLRQFGMEVSLDEGILWGAVVGLIVTYTPYFLRTGKMVTKRDIPVLDFFAGVLVFLLISAVVVLIFYGIFWILSFFIH